MNVRLTILFLFLCSMSWGQKTEFSGFTLDHRGEVYPHILISCRELPEFDLQSDANGYFSINLKARVYHFLFESERQVMKYINLDDSTKIEKSMLQPTRAYNSVTVDLTNIYDHTQAIVLFNPMVGFSLSRLDMLDDYPGGWMDKYYRKMIKVSEKSSSTLRYELGDFEIGNISCEFDRESNKSEYEFELIMLKWKKVRKLYFGRRADIIFFGEGTEDTRHYSNFEKIPTFQTRGDDIIFKFNFSRKGDHRGEHSSILVALDHNDSTVFHFSDYAWEKPDDYLWLKKDFQVPGQEEVCLEARNQAILDFKEGKVGKCPEKGKERQEGVLKRDMDIPPLRLRNFESWRRFSECYCPVMDSLIQDKHGEDVFQNITYQLFQKDSLKKRVIVDWPLFPGGDSALTVFFRQNLNSSNLTCKNLNTTLAQIEATVSENGKVIDSLTRIEYPKIHKSWNYEEVLCEDLRLKILGTMDLLPDWEPAIDGFQDLRDARVSISLTWTKDLEIRAGHARLLPMGYSQPWSCGTEEHERRWISDAYWVPEKSKWDR